MATPSPWILISPASAERHSFHCLQTFAWFSLYFSCARRPSSPYTPYEVHFMRHSARIFTFLLLSLCLALLSAVAFDTPLTDSAIREAYFLGLRHDDKTRVTLEQYSRHLPAPEKGPHVAEIGLYTPYAQIVQQTLEKMTASSAQQAAEDFHKQKETIQVRLLILLTPTYSYTMASREPGNKQGLQFRSNDFWQDFSFSLRQHETEIEPLSVHGEPYYQFQTIGPTGVPINGQPNPQQSVLNGARVWLEYDAAAVASDDAQIEVVTPDGQHVTATFDLSRLR